MKKKLIAFDIPHLADFNLVRNSIILLANNDSYEVNVYALDRGKLFEIVRRELPQSIKVIKLGTWKRGKLLKIFITNFFRIFQFIWIFIRKKPSIGISPGSLPFSIALTVLNVKNLQFSDDLERWFLNLLESKFATEKYYPNVTKVFSNSKIKKIPSLKQWAYLSPKYFTPDNRILSKYGLEEKKYFFVREITTASTNYSDQPKYLVGKVAHLFPKNYKVVLSLEDKSASNIFPEDWIILKEPVDNFHSLIYYSKALISSGDSMAIEGGVLGVPSIYCGIRFMEANKILEKQGMLVHSNYADIPQVLNKIISGEKDFEDQSAFRTRLSSEFIELTDFIVSRAESIIGS